MLSRMKWLNIYRKFSKDILLQNSVSQPGFDFFTAIWSARPLKKSSCLQQVLCLPGGRTEQRDSCYRDFQPILLLFFPEDLFGYYCHRILLMQLGSAPVPWVQRAFALRSHRHISGTACEVYKGLSLKTPNESSDGWYQAFSFALISALHKTDTMPCRDHQWGSLVKYWDIWVRVPFKHELQLPITHSGFGKILFKIFGSSVRQ